jgi:aminopeptidase N
MSHVEQGISITLARERVRVIDGVRYELAFEVPEMPSSPISARTRIHFSIRDVSEPLALDFVPGVEALQSLAVNGRPAQYRGVNGHIVISPEHLVPDENTIDIAFAAGDASLNRNAEFLYTLFVPARAHHVFPCFDQPDLKARFQLELTLHASWQAVANGEERSREPLGERVRVRFAETPPIPTYLFAFAAGKFQMERAERNGRVYRMFHRETDPRKLARNRQAIFDLHASSLHWLEEYTQIPYAFGKFDFVLIPSFQFSGMEHPGAILYNAASLLLEESATENQMFSRASIIAHETAHMWFGDLVTMPWFDDVWMKEVFANFLAAKIVNPEFPDVNHDLRFFLSHYPAAYAVDRTAGSHPIRQELENLNDAGGLYGAIIYQKAPIVMRQLERLLGPDALRDGLRAYLQKFRFGNAAWPDLVALLNERSAIDLAEWSRAWVEEAGRPSIRTEISADGQITLTQADLQPGRSLRWRQQMQVLLGTGTGAQLIPVELHGERTELPGLYSSLEYVLPSGEGLAYGDFTLDPRSRDFLLKNLPDVGDSLTRGAAWVTLWEELLNRRVRASDFVLLALKALPNTNTEQNMHLVLGYLGEAFWRFLQPSVRDKLASALEQVLRRGFDGDASSTKKAVYLGAFRSMATSADGIAYLERIWRRQEKIPGLSLGELDESAIAMELALRSVSRSAGILEEQRRRFTNPDWKERFEFVMPTASDRGETRDTFFRSLFDVRNRRREPWVVEAVRYLNHPLRSVQSIRYIRPALDMLQEIQRTGDIFFPRNWTEAVLSGHNSLAAAQTVREFLFENENYPIRLRRLILQSGDPLFRAIEILKES